MTTTLGILFAGGSVFSADLPPGCHVAWVIEYDATIAAVNQANNPETRVIAADVRGVDFATLPRVDILQASPPCPNYSVAKTNGAETAQDRALAEAVCVALRTLRPRAFILENVRGYAGSESLKRIGQTLFDLDYAVTQEIVNSADYGVPQTRERLIVRAVSGGFMQSIAPIPGRVATWRGWYSAIEDLIPTLPASKFADWQLRRLGEMSESFATAGEMADPNGTAERRLSTRFQDEPFPPVTATITKRAPTAFIVSNADTMGIRDGDAPMLSVTGQTGGRARAVLMGDGDTWRPVRSGSEMAPTLSANNGARAFLMGKTADKYGDGLRYHAEPAQTIGANEHGSRAWLAAGRVVAMTPRALARFQSMPDSYELPSKASLACRIIGNGVPSLLGRRIVESLL